MSHYAWFVQFLRENPIPSVGVCAGGLQGLAFDVVRRSLTLLIMQSERMTFNRVPMACIPSLGSAASRGKPTSSDLLRNRMCWLIDLFASAMCMNALPWPVFQLLNSQVTPLKNLLWQVEPAHEWAAYGWACACSSSSVPYFRKSIPGSISLA